MKPLTRMLGLPAVAAGFGLLATMPAWADPPYCSPREVRLGLCDPHHAHEHHRDDQATFRAYEQGYRDGQQTAWRAGDPFTAENYVVIRDFREYGLAPPPYGHYYVMVDDDVLLIEEATKLVVQLEKY